MSRIVMRLAFAVCLCFATVTSAWAQDDRKVGLTIGYPSAAGVIWQAADRVAIRTDTFFSSSWTDTPDEGANLLRLVGASSSSSGQTLGVGVSVLVTVAKWESLRAYLAPRVGYARASNESEVSLSAGLPGIPTLAEPLTFETKTATQSYGVSFGAQYGLGDRFAAFGEVGVAYASSRPSSDASIAFNSGNSPQFSGGVFGGLASAALSSIASMPRPGTNNVGLRSGVGVIFFF